MLFEFIILSVFGIIRAQYDDSLLIPRDFKLELVQVLFRHGERTCIEIELETYSYLNVSVYEPYGIGQLTNNGKESMYNVGRILRERYDGFLNEKYLSEEVYAYSSEDDRTKMSLQLVLAGLYPPSPGLVWNPNLEWQPLPFRYTPKEVDILMKSRNSKKFQKLLTEVRKQKTYLDEISQYPHIIDLVRNLTRGVVTFEIPSNLLGVYNTLYVHERMGLPLPNWYTDEVKRDMRACYEIINRSEGMTLKQNRLNGGPMIRTTLQNMNLEGELVNPRKIYLYSGHDLTLNGFLRALKIRELEFIDFGTTLILEKFRDSENQLYVRLLSYNPDDKKTITLRISECGEFCPINVYQEHISDVIPTDEEMHVLMDEFNVHKLKELFFQDNTVKKLKL